MADKLTSRKLWIAIGGSAAGVASIVSGLVIPNEKATLALTIVGACLTGVSVVAYQFAEAYVDGQSAKSKTEAVVTTTNVNANTSSTQTVEKIINKDAQPVIPDSIKIGGSE